MYTGQPEGAMSDTQPTFACDLGALSAEERAQPADGPVWVRFRGGPGTKEFLTAAGLKATARR